ncbi:MAG: rod shape-determining protein RodA [Clostridium sp.]|nr:rod shape-determining protein RodA [Clostridium sp.]
MSLFDKKYFKHIDWMTVAIVLGLVAFGTIALASVMATPFDGTEASLSDYMSRFNMEYLTKHITNFLIGCAAMLVVIVFDYSIFKSLSVYIYAGIIGLLALLFVFGKVRGGAQGWFVFDTIERAIQPGELCKIALIISLAKVVSAAMDRDGRLLKLKDIAAAVAITALPFMLIVLQPDYGTAFVLLVILFVIIFIARIKWIYIIAAAVMGGGGIVLAYNFILTDKQRARIDVFLRPETMSDNDKYHITKSKMAIGSGQLLGKGFFGEETLAQMRYIPARHTDFIFSGITEAVGFVGSCLLIVALFALIFRWVYISYKARDSFGTLLVAGVTAMLAAHVFENIGMTMGLMPITGIPLPFISYGGSNMLTNMIGVGIVLNVYMRRPLKQRHVDMTAA